MTGEPINPGDPVVVQYKSGGKVGGYLDRTEERMVYVRFQPEAKNAFCYHPHVIGARFEEA